MQTTQPTALTLNHEITLNMVIVATACSMTDVVRHLDSEANLMAVVEDYVLDYGYRALAKGDLTEFFDSISHAKGFLYAAIYHIQHATPDWVPSTPVVYEVVFKDVTYRGSCTSREEHTLTRSQ
ncbi:hypothetical protein AB6D11_18675 [Vibrio splendidus]